MGGAIVRAGVSDTGNCRFGTRGSRLGTTAKDVMTQAGMERSAMTVSRFAVIVPEYRLHSGFC
ncbi:MAG: hypothetical protein FWE95_09380 [Planctomycetaceae bacterium]|nr:hypothetical protein [Planctomycetaceae bacterium]